LCGWMSSKLRFVQEIYSWLSTPSTVTKAWARLKFSPPKERLIVRLLAQRELRFKLSRFTDNPEELAISYRRESLREMCREAGIWRSGNKRALSAGLLNWRDRCRARGQTFFAEMRSLAEDRPQQLTFRFLVLS